VDEVLPHQPMRQWVLSVPFPLRFLFASQPGVMGRVLGIVYRTIATHLTHKAGYTNSRAHTGAVTLIQRFGGAVNLIQHYVGYPYDIHGKYKRGSSVQTYDYVLLGTRLKETGPITNAIAYRAFGIMYAIIPTIIMLGRGSNRVQNLFKFLVVSLMTATAVAGNALALDPPESELTTAHTLRNVFKSALPQVEGPVEVTVSFELRDIDHIDDEAETFEFTGVIKLSWHDPRQAFDPAIDGTEEKIYQGSFQFDEVFTGWFPQLILVNQSGLYEKHGVLLRVRSDGLISMYETMNAVGKIDLDLRRYPIDQQRLEAVFHVLGFDSNEITLRLEPEYNDGDLNIDEIFKLPQWQLTGIKSSIGTRNTPLIGKGATTSTFVVSIDLQRSSFFILRLVILPLIIIVMLSWSVFWMDKTSLGDRISVSFIGILTAVTYQVILSEILPRISYFTLINDGFLGFSFFIMSMTVIVNLRVGYLDRHGMSEAGDRLDHLCKWMFPVIYFGALLVMFWMSSWL
jgi:hypothetical protein